MRVRRVRRIRHGSVAAAAGTGRAVTVAPERAPEVRPRVVMAGSRLFLARMARSLAGETSFDVAARAESAKSALAAVVTERAELAVIEVGGADVAERLMLAHAIKARRPGCGIMLICESLTESIARRLWVYGAESWSVITAASSKNPAQVAEAVSSAVRGITWVEPGVQRVMASFGPRPKSVEERRLLMLDAHAVPAGQYAA